ncbi:MAG: FAD-dependent oxidoreductase [Deltaproteobacteria bacterium]|nr:FAD-dependent oxidoreductase [Deltaproteobacteria bacterium]
MSKQLLLVGGGHAHMMCLAAIHEFVGKGYDVTVIGPSEYHYYSGMGPGMLGGFYTPEDIRFATRHVVEKQGGKFILGKAVRVDPEKNIVFLESGEEVHYDVVSFNAGSHIPMPDIEGEADNIYTAKPIERLLEARDRIRASLSEKALRIGVIGGGPSSVEIAGNVWRLGKDAPNSVELVVFAGSVLMARFPDGIKDRARKSLTQRGIKVIEGSRATGIKNSVVILDTGEIYPFDFIFLGLGVRPNPIFKDSGLPVGPDDGLLVNKYLQSVRYENMFGGGDCIYFKDQPLNKVGVYAVRENPVLLNNLMAQLEAKPLQAFDPGGDYLLIFNMGDETGILKKKWITFGGRLAFTVKDYIDMKFMKKFQAIE